MNRENRNALRRCERARKFPDNTCPASRSVFLTAEIMAHYGPHVDMLSPTFTTAMLATVEALWKARTEIDRLKKKLGERS